MKKQLTILCLLLFCLSLFTAGCWDQIEVEELALVRAIAIDYQPGRRSPYLVTFAISLPSDVAGGEGGGGGGGEPTQLFSGVGASMDLALHQASLNLSRQLFLSHASVILIGEEMAKHGLAHVFDFIIRNPQVRLNAYLLYTNGFAQQMLTTTERLEIGITEEIIGMIEQARFISETEPLPAYKFLQKVVTPGQAAYTALLQKGSPLEEIIPGLQGEQKPGGQEESSGGSDSSEGGGGEKAKEVLTLAGLAAFRNQKLAGLMNAQETRGFLWFLGKTSRTYLAISDPQKPKEIITLHVSRAETKIKPQIKNGQLSFSVEVVTEGDIRSQTSTTKINTPEMMKKVNSANAAVIKQEMEKALHRMQQLQTDLVGFGSILNRHEPKLFSRLQDNWPEEFSKLKVEIVVTSDVRRAGMQANPALPRGE
ncbi:MAG TPA: Ger(x)C family spore germination protein [Oscillospiraceae bacterium]|nr:Ger(x)C family spore germination protein [Oscillospiraceae bacterium]